MIKVNKIISLLLVILSLFGCNNLSRNEISVETIPATCYAEGYVEHRFDDGYIFRDNFTPKIEHNYHIYSFSNDENIVRHICSNCGNQIVEYVSEEINTDVDTNVERQRPSFIGLDTMACAMILEQNIDDCIRSIRLADKHGAYGFMVYVSCLKSEYRTLEQLKKIFYCTEKPVLAIAYNNSYFFPQNLTYDEIASLLILSIQAGASAVDIMGYLYDDYETMPSSLKANKTYWEEKGYSMSFVDLKPKEVTGDENVINKQNELISQVHALGGEVLLSLHVGVIMNSNQIVDLALFMLKQDIDIIKMVLSGSSKETVIEHLKACMELTKKQQEGAFPIKYSVHGQSSLSRIMCPMFGSYIAFCVDKYTEVETNIQVDLETMLAILNSPELKGGE